MKSKPSSIKVASASIATAVVSLLNSIKAFAYDGAIITTPDGKEGIVKVLSIVADIMSALVAILAIVGIAISGVQYLTASGNEEQLKKSKRRIFEIVIGVAAYFIIYELLKWLLPGFNGTNI